MLRCLIDSKVCLTQSLALHPNRPIFLAFGAPSQFLAGILQGRGLVRTLLLSALQRWEIHLGDGVLVTTFKKSRTLQDSKDGNMEIQTKITECVRARRLFLFFQLA